jgi:hypothetical protein
MSDIGAITGLAVGVSVVSFVEIFDLAIDIFFFSLKRYFTSRVQHRQQAQVPRGMGRAGGGGGDAGSGGLQGEVAAEVGDNLANNLDVELQEFGRAT